MPARGRYPSSQFIEISEWYGLIDCGEGTQIQLSRYHIKRNKISQIFISHLHGDHVFGLPGLLGSYNHFNREKLLVIHGPYGIKKFIETIAEVSGARYNYPIEIIELDNKNPGSIVVNDELTVSYFPLKHRIPTLGYRFNYYQSKINIRKEAIDKFNLTVPQILEIKKGNNVLIKNGKELEWNKIADKIEIEKSYAYCSDTIYDPEIIPQINGVDFLYHETTYLDGMEEEAMKRKHATLGQAIDIALQAKVKNLITGHYSSRYRDLDEFYKVTRRKDVNIIIGTEGLVINL